MTKDKNNRECQVCGYVYDPEKGDPLGDVPPNTIWDALQNEWTCPVCKADKDSFEEADSE